MHQPQSNQPHRAGVTSVTLLAQMRGNDPEAWRTMIQLYGPLVRHWCRGGGGATDDLDDLSQEVFRIAAVRLVDFRRDRPGDSFRGWLRGIARNVLLKHRWRQAQAPRAAGGTDAWKSLESIPEPAEDSTDHRDIDSDDTERAEKAAVYARLLEIARAHFEEKTWQAFYQTAVEGRPADEVAVQLGLTAVAVRKYKSRVLQRLRREYSDLLE